MPNPEVNDSTDLAFFNKKIIELCTSSNLLISPETLQFINQKRYPLDFIQKTIAEIANSEKKPLVLTKDILEKILQQKSLLTESSVPISQEIEHSTPSISKETPELMPKPADEPTEITTPSVSSTDHISPFAAADIPEDIVILKDPTGLMLGEGKIGDMRAYSKDKFKKLRSLLFKRPDCKGAISIEQAKSRANSAENKVRVIGMILNRKEMSAKSKSKLNDTTSNSISIELDDLESSMTVIFSGKNDELIKKAARITTDQVICIEGFVSENGVLIASDCFWSEVPFHPMKAHDIPPISAIFISDTHFGSKYFLTDKFEAFLEWLQGRTGSELQKALAKSVKYIIIAGDLIEGIGVYPDQEKNLAIIDISEQYDFAAKYLKRIPNHIKIIIIPGGPHDAVRKAYPQPALGKKYASALYSLNNVILLGNPAQLTIHGVNILVFHGDSLDDLVQVIPGLSYEKPAEIMKELVVSRHLTPIYGYSTWIAPEKEDWMVIDEIPEIMHCGHTHVSDFKQYRGVILLNSGTFQGETDYQQSLGVKPTPGKIPIVNLQNMKVKFLQF